MTADSRIFSYPLVEKRILKWIEKYVKDNQLQSLVVGVSGGIDSAVVSTLCAKVRVPVFALGMPIHQDSTQESMSDFHLAWLEEKYPNVKKIKIALTDLFETFKKTMGDYSHDELALANTRSRLRMTTLYQIAGKYNGIVVGTGNKVEDYGVGFFTKYGDGGVDIAPIADLYKTEVRRLGEYLGVDKRFIEAVPTDGLWDDKRSDEDQLGATYADLEEVMEKLAPGGSEYCEDNYELYKGGVYDVYKKWNTMNKHKMEPIPTFRMDDPFDYSIYKETDWEKPSKRKID